MRHYELYLLEEQVARHYFGRETKLFQLFLEHADASLSQRLIIDKQIEYISKPLPSLLLQQKLTFGLKHIAEFTESKHSYFIQLRQPPGCAELVIYKNHLTLTSEGDIEAETIFFEILRKVDPCFFAVNLEEHRFGWLNPIRQVKLI